MYSLISGWMSTLKKTDNCQKYFPLVNFCFCRTIDKKRFEMAFNPSQTDGQQYFLFWDHWCWSMPLHQHTLIHSRPTNFQNSWFKRSDDDQVICTIWVAAKAEMSQELFYANNKIHFVLTEMYNFQEKCPGNFLYSIHLFMYVNKCLVINMNFEYLKILDTHHAF